MLVAYGKTTWSMNNDMTKNQKNNALALEYKSASEYRQREIFSEYFELNKKFCTTFLNWGEEHWADLTNTFVTYWPAAFMRYTPHDEKSVFNFYMDQNYKRRACMDYKRWVKNGENASIEAIADDGGVYDRRCLSIPFDPSVASGMLKDRLCRVLSAEEVRVFDASFYAGLSQFEVAESLYPIRNSKQVPGQAKVSRRKRYKKIYEGMIGKLKSSFNRGDFDEVRDCRDPDHSLYHIGYNSLH